MRRKPAVRSDGSRRTGCERAFGRQSTGTEATLPHGRVITNAPRRRPLARHAGAEGFGRKTARMPTPARKVVVIGLDGLDPVLLDERLAAGDAPNFARLAERSVAARVATTCPAQTPVAWSSFATGTNPG